MRYARPKDIQDNGNLSGGLGEVFETPRLSPLDYLCINRFRVGEDLSQTAGQFHTGGLWAYLYTSMCAVGHKTGSVCLLSSQETSRFLISRGREKDGLPCPHFGEMLPVTFSHVRPPPPTHAGSPFRSISIFPSQLSCPHQPHPYLFSFMLWLAAVFVIPGYCSPEPFANKSLLV